LTEPTPDFDAEKRRRWYAVSLGAAGSTSLLGMLVLREGLPPEDVVIVLSGFWILFFIFKSIAAYALWFRPYSAKVRGLLLSCLAIFLTYAAMFSVILFYDAVSGLGMGLRDSIETFFEFHELIIGVPYIAGAVIGWLYARPAPDVRESF